MYNIHINQKGYLLTSKCVMNMKAAIYEKAGKMTVAEIEKPSPVSYKHLTQPTKA
ncbi:hypothetical protein [Streptococcus suis]